MSATTRLSVTEPMLVQNGYAPGQLAIVSRTVGHPISVDLMSESGSETVLLIDDGDSMAIDLTGIMSATIASVDGTYPVDILYLNTTLPISLSAAPVIGNTAANPVPVTVV